MIRWRCESGVKGRCVLFTLARCAGRASNGIENPAPPPCGRIVTDHHVIYLHK